MKIRKGFVSNSSSSSFTVRNLTDEDLSWKDFISDIREIILKYMAMYEHIHGSEAEVAVDDMVCVADTRDFFKAYQTVELDFGDNHKITGTVGSSIIHCLGNEDHRTETGRFLINSS